MKITSHLWVELGELLRKIRFLVERDEQRVFIDILAGPIANPVSDYILPYRKGQRHRPALLHVHKE